MGETRSADKYSMMSSETTLVGHVTQPAAGLPSACRVQGLHQEKVNLASTSCSHQQGTTSEASSARLADPPLY